MTEVFLIAALILLVAGVVGSFIPMIPGAVLSLIGVSIYWWNTGFSQPNLLIVVLLYFTAVTALLFDLFAGAIGSKAGGASNKTVQMSAIAGIIFFFIAGPIGIIIGIAAIVFLREYLLTEESKMSLKAAFYTAGTVLGSAIVQGFLTTMTLIIFLLSVTF